MNIIFNRHQGYDRMIFKQLYLNDYLGLNLERGMGLKINKFKFYPLFSLYYKYSFQQINLNLKFWKFYVFKKIWAQKAQAG